MTVSTPVPMSQIYPSGLSADMPGHQLTYTGVAPGGKRLPSLSFHGLLEIVNPLEHLPVVSTIYQAVTGDHPSPGEQIVGDTLYGGPLGLATAVVQIMANGAAEVIEGNGATSASPPAAVASATTTAIAPATTTAAAQAAKTDIEIGGKAHSLGLTPAGILPGTSPRTNAGTAGPAIDLAVADPGSAVFDPTSSNPADPGAISGPLTDTGGAVSPTAKNPSTPTSAPVPLAPPDAAPNTPSPAKKAVALGRKTVFMPLPKRGTHFFPLNNAPSKKTFYRLGSTGPAPADAASAAGMTSSLEGAAKTPQAPSPTRATSAPETPTSVTPASVTPASVTPSAIAAALAPAIDAPQLPSFSPASSLSDPLAPSLSSAALATTEAASDKYNRALDLAQKLKFFYGGATPGSGLSP